MYHCQMYIVGSSSSSSVAVSVGSALQQRQEEEAKAKAAAEERARIQREREERNTKLTSNLLKMVRAILFEILRGGGENFTDPSPYFRCIPSTHILFPPLLLGISNGVALNQDANH